MTYRTTNSELKDTRKGNFPKYLLTALAGLIALWIGWPLIVFSINKALQEHFKTVIDTGLIGQIGDSYGSFNSLIAIAAGSVAFATWRTQQAQIKQTENHNSILTALSLISSYHSLNREADFSQRMALLVAISIAISNVQEQDQSQLFAAIHLNQRELEAIGNIKELASLPWRHQNEKNNK